MSSGKYFQADHQEEFQYLPYMVFYVLFVFLGVFLINKCLFDRKKYLSKGYDDNYLGSETLPELCLSYCFNMFCCCLRPCFGGKRPILYPTVLFTSHCHTSGAFFLAVIRVVSFLLILFIDIYQELSVENGSTSRFSSWNNIASVIFFFCISLLSCVGLFHKICCSNGDTDQSWSLVYEKFSVFCLLLYEVIGSNSIFITIVTFSWHQSVAKDTQGILVHVLVTCCFVVDMLFNQLPFRSEHYFYSLLLPVCYLCYQWGMVYDDRLAWQYTFLQTADNDCFFKYSVLFLIHLACYYGIVLVHFARDRFFGTTYEDRHRVAEEDYEDDDDDGQGVEEGGIQIMISESPTAPANPQEEKEGKDGRVPIAQVLTTSGRYSPVSQI